MGGNLFKLGRLPQAQYHTLESQLRQYLDTRFGEHYRIPRYYHSKPDFGDIDVLLSSAALPDGGWTQLRLQIIQELGIQDYKMVNRVLSTVYHDFQTDFFILPQADFLSTWQFLCYNDLGNLLGKLFRRFNLKYGEEGLSYVYRRPDSDHYKRDLPLTQDMSHILSFLGLDYQTWDTGFNTLEDMFKWVTTSPYFTVEPFLERTATTQKRAQHRPTMAKFIAWLQQEGIQTRYPFLEDRDQYLPLIISHFPQADLPAQILAEEARTAQVQALQAKFSGQLVMQHFPDLQGDRLGRFIVAFKATFTDFESELLAMSPTQILDRLQSTYQHFLQQE